VLCSVEKEDPMKRRTFLKRLAVGTAAGVGALRAPVVLGQAKPFAGVTINGAAAGGLQLRPRP
jgi:hypothetical protein